jgi:hypothetical protein
MTRKASTMRPTSSLLLAAALASLALAGGAAEAQRAYPNAASPRAPGTPLPMDPSWSSGFDPLDEESLRDLRDDPLFDPLDLTDDAGEAERMAAALERRGAEMRRMVDPNAALPAGRLRDPLDFSGPYGPGAAGYAGVGGPAAGSASAYSYSAQTDETGCTRSRETAQSWPGPAPSVVTRAEGCGGAPAGPARPEADEEGPEDGD